MDDLESRLADELARHAAGMPRYDGDVRRVTRRGRNRRWAVRGAGAVGAIVLLGGAAVIYQAADGGDLETVMTRTPLVVAAPTPTPTPTPQPEATPELAATPLPSPTPVEETVVRDVFAVSATGWGVGLVGTGGDLFATLTCCDDEGEDWRAQPGDAPVRGALRVRDDLRGGLVVSTQDTLWLQPAAAFGTDQEAEVIDHAPAGEGAEVSVNLWDVTLVDDTVRILYSVSEVDASGLAGRDELRAAEVRPGRSPVVDVVGVSTWTADSPGFIRNGAAWVGEGGHMELRQAIGGDGPACEWIEYVETDPAFVSPFGPPGPDGGCPHDSIGAAAMNAQGQLAVIERFLSQPPATAVLAVYDRVGNRLHDFPLPETASGEPLWTELDIVGSAVLVSRAAFDSDPEADIVLRYDLGAAVNPRELAFVGNPTFARSNLVTSGLTPLDPGAATWFGDATVVPAPTPDPDAAQGEDDSPVEPEASPQPTKNPTLTPPAVVSDEDRLAVGRGVNVVATDAGVGTDGCLRLEEAICLGAPIADALVVAERLFGPSPDGEPPGRGVHVFVGGDREVHLTEDDGVVSEIRMWPGAARVATTTFGETIDKLGPPAAMSLEDEGGDVLWVLYDSSAAYVGYGHLQPPDTDASVLTTSVDDGFPAAYDNLGVNSIWIRPAGSD